MRAVQMTCKTGLQLDAQHLSQLQKGAYDVTLALHAACGVAISSQLPNSQPDDQDILMILILNQSLRSCIYGTPTSAKPRSTLTPSSKKSKKH